jgi:hypothetical protein
LSTERYCILSDVFLDVGSTANRIYCKIEGAKASSPNTWEKVGEGYASGWPGSNYLKMVEILFGGAPSQTSQYWNLRFTFRTCSTALTFNDADLSTSYSSLNQYIFNIQATGKSVFVPSNSMMRYGHIYSYDKDKNATFPAAVNAQNMSVTSNLTIGNMVTASSFYQSSLRELKKNIRPFKGSAIDILNTVSVKSFKYKKGDGEEHIGFIADDTHELLSGSNHDHADHGNVIGLLIKAIQELTEKNVKLQKMLDELC